MRQYSAMRTVWSEDQFCSASPVAMKSSIVTATALGLPGVQKEWLTAGDDRVRDDHFMVDGDVVELDEPWDVGGEELDYPGDQVHGSAENTINCRCVVAYRTDRR